MKYYETNGQVGPDGTVFIRAPKAFANRTVKVRIEAGPPPMTPEERRAWLHSVVATVDDPTFVRPPQDPWPDRKIFD